MDLLIRHVQKTEWKRFKTVSKILKIVYRVFHIKAGSSLLKLAVEVLMEDWQMKKRACRSVVKLISEGIALLTALLGFFL